MGVVADADRLLGEAREVRASYPQGNIEDQQVAEASELLGQLLMQDVERRVDGMDTFHDQDLPLGLPALGLFAINGLLFDCPQPVHNIAHHGLLAA